MMLWLILALMTAAAVFAVLWPLGRKTELRADSDIAVYRAQLDEIEADRAAGRIAESEAAAARVEVSRRLLAAADTAATVVASVGAPADAIWRRRAAALAALLFIPIGAGLLYLTFGSPHEPGQPLAARRDMPTGRDSIFDLVARVEAHLAQNPDDGRGWQVVAPVYMQLGRFDDAVNAWQNALRILGPSAEREADLGEALTAAGGGIVTAEAKAAFDRAQALDANDITSRFFFGLAAEQDGKRAEAAAIWRDMLAKAPPEARWVDAVRQALARAEGTAGPAAPKGPTEKDLTTANELTPEQRTAMVQGMVARLAERLKTEGSDVEGWLRLVRSYMVLGEREKARAAAADARRALASEPDKLQRVNELIKGLGLES